MTLERAIVEEVRGMKNVGTIYLLDIQQFLPGTIMPLPHIISWLRILHFFEKMCVHGFRKMYAE